MTEGEPTDAEPLAHCIVAIVESLRALGYQHPQYTQMRNEHGEIILADSPDGKIRFAIQVRTW